MRIGRLLQVRQAAAGYQEGAAGIHLMHQVKTLHRRIGGTGQPDRAGVVDHDINAAEMFRCLCSGSDHLILFANIHLQRQCMTASRLNSRSRGVDGAG